MGALKIPKNLAQPKKRGKIKVTPFLDVFEVSGSESEVRISIKILVLKLSNLMTLIVRNCTIAPIGQLRYLAPEIILSESIVRVNKSTDVYVFACVGMEICVMLSTTLSY